MSKVVKYSLDRILQLFNDKVQVVPGKKDIVELLQNIIHLQETEHEI